MKKIICFYNPEEEYGYLSNWYPSKFQYGSVLYSSMEQYMMHQKAVLFRDPETAGHILETSRPDTIKALGREVKHYEESIWNGFRQIIVYRGLMEKFGQNAELRKYLLFTENAILAECAVQDRIWGIGLSMQDESRLDLKKWRGQNLLGFTLMQVRMELAGTSA